MTTAEPTLPDWHVVMRFDELANGEIRRLVIEGHALVVLRSGDSPHACQGSCPHERADLGQGRIEGGRIEGARIVCPRHLASFALSDGSVSAGWAVEPLKTYPVRVNEGAIEIDLAAIRRSPPQGETKVWTLTGL